jgi:hypothetical protein
MYEDKNTLVAAGDCVHQRPGIVNYLYDYSPDMQYLEVVGPASRRQAARHSPISGGASRRATASGHGTGPSGAVPT